MTNPRFDVAVALFQMGHSGSSQVVKAAQSLVTHLSLCGRSTV